LLKAIKLTNKLTKSLMFRLVLLCECFFFLNPEPGIYPGFFFAKELESFGGKIQLKKDVSRQKKSRYAASHKEARSRQNVCNTELFLLAKKKKNIEKEE